MNFSLGNFSTTSDTVDTIFNPEIPGGLIPQKVNHYLNYALNFIWLFTIIIGLYFNALIMRAYYHMGLEDSVSICFFFQAILDFATLFGPIGNLVIAIFVVLQEYDGLFLKVQLMGIIIYLTLFASFCNFLACLNTTFLAVLRALCIFKPLQFRNMMNRTRTWIFLGLATVFALTPCVLYASVYQYRLEIVDTNTNATRYMVFIAKHHEAIKFLVVTVFQVILFIFFQVLVFGSLLVMFYTLKASVRFRQTATNTSVIKDESLKKDGQKSQKERIAIIQVSLVSAFFLLLNLPRFLVAFVQWVEPEFEMNGRYYEIWSVCMAIRMTFEYFNTLVNLPIYYKYNSKFRKVCFRSKEFSE